MKPAATNLDLFPRLVAGKAHLAVELEGQPLVEPWEADVQVWAWAQVTVDALEVLK